MFYCLGCFCRAPDLHKVCNVQLSYCLSFSAAAVANMPSLDQLVQCAVLYTSLIEF